MFKACIITYAVFLSFSLKSQDSTQTLRLSKTYYLFERDTAGNGISADTSFNHVQNYFDRNIMGNIGLPDYPLLYHFNSFDPIGVKWFTSPYDNRMLGKESHIYFQQRGIFTNLFGAAGSTKEQTFKLFHSQNLNDRLNFSLKLNRYSANGFYQYQRSFVNNVLFSSNSISKNKRTGYYASVSFDRFKYLENGGIVSDSVIIAEPLTEKGLIPVYLDRARRNFTYLAADANFFLKLNKDSSSVINHYVTAGAKFSRMKNIYVDYPLAGYYSDIYKDSASTNDSIIFSKLSPSLDYEIMTKQLFVKIGARYDYSEYNTTDTLRNFSSSVLTQSFGWKSSTKKSYIKENAEYIIEGMNSGDYRAELDAGMLLKFLSSGINVRIFYEERSPDLFFNDLLINNYKWHNDFKKTQTLSGEFKLNIEKYRLKSGVVISSISNMIVLGPDSKPFQASQAAGVVHAFISHHLKVYKFHFENTVHYQHTSNKLINLPELYTQHQLYFEHRVKRNGLKFQVGIQAEYISEMDKLSYNPALNSFYLLYGNQKGGNYIFGDFFFNVYFKPVKLFFKAEHLNQGFTGTNYSLLNNYYQRDRAFRFGINWEFRD